MPQYIIMLLFEVRQVPAETLWGGGAGLRSGRDVLSCVASVEGLAGIWIALVRLEGKKGVSFDSPGDSKATRATSTGSPHEVESEVGGVGAACTRLPEPRAIAAKTIL